MDRPRHRIDLSNRSRSNLQGLCSVQIEAHGNVAEILNASITGTLKRGIFIDITAAHNESDIDRWIKCKKFEGVEAIATGKICTG